MPERDYDDPEVEKQWCAERRDEVAHYLSAEHLTHGEIGEWPAWHVAPAVSIWAIENPAKPGWVGMWVICGDLPTDYISAASIKHPRDAMQALSERWSASAATIRGGGSSTEIEIPGIEESPEEMLRMLESRAATLANWAGDDSMWEASQLRATSDRS